MICFITQLIGLISRKLKYINWSVEVVKGCAGVNGDLEHEFHLLVQKGMNMLNT